VHETTAAQRTTYLRGLLQRYGTLSLPLGSGLSFSLIQVFQPLRLRRSAAHDEKQPEHNDEETQHATREEAEEQDEAGEREESVERLAENGLEALNKSPRGRMVILGSPGMGKTTVLKHLLCHHAQLALEDSTAPLPVFLSLPDLARAGSARVPMGTYPHDEHPGKTHIAASARDTVHSVARSTWTGTRCRCFGRGKLDSKRPYRATGKCDY